mmetsp:Transcript_49982/g.119297  ORF Transcript_49982/g.119297 Transcript_49982/m.119297 type:complete len:230 (+) Transcript_49982:125-814(+)
MPPPDPTSSSATRSALASAWRGWMGRQRSKSRKTGRQTSPPTSARAAPLGTTSATAPTAWKVRIQAPTRDGARSPTASWIPATATWTCRPRWQTATCQMPATREKACGIPTLLAAARTTGWMLRLRSRSRRPLAFARRKWMRRSGARRAAAALATMAPPEPSTSPLIRRSSSILQIPEPPANLGMPRGTLIVPVISQQAGASKNGAMWTPASAIWTCRRRPRLTCPAAW